MVVLIAGERVLKVDSHTHILPSSIPDKFDIPLRLIKYEKKTTKGFAARLEFKKTGKLFRELKPNCFDTKEVIKQCDKCGVDVQVMCTVPVMFNYDLPPSTAIEWVQFLNDDLIRSVNEQPDRLEGLGTLPLQDTEASVREIRRCHEKGIKGYQIGSHVNAYRGVQEDGVTPIVKHLPLNHEDLRPVFAELEKVGACLMIHPWDMEWWCANQYWQPWLVGMPSETTLAGTALILGGVLTQFPKLRIMMSHGGGSLVYLRGRIDWGYKCRPDLVAKDCPELPSKMIKKLYFDSITHDEGALAFMVKFVGPEKVMLGSDYPFPLGEVPSIAPVTEETLLAYPGQLIQDASMITISQKKALLGLSCLEWLGISPAKFVDRLRDLSVKAQLAVPPSQDKNKGKYSDDFGSDNELASFHERKEGGDGEPRAPDYFPVDRNNCTRSFRANPLAELGHQRDSEFPLSEQVRAHFPRGDIVAAAGHSLSRPCLAASKLVDGVFDKVNSSLHAVHFPSGMDAEKQSLHNDYAYKLHLHQPSREVLAELLGCDANDVMLGNGLSEDLIRLVNTHFHPQVLGTRRKIMCLSRDFNSDLTIVRTFLLKAVVNALLAAKPLFENADLAEVLGQSEQGKEYHRLCSIFLGTNDAAMKSEEEQFREIETSFIQQVTPTLENGLYDEDSIIATINSCHHALAGALLPSVVFHTSQLLDMGRINGELIAKKVLCVWDMAHSVGNVQHSLTRDRVVAGAGCGYKHLNGLPGGPGFIYQNAALLGELSRSSDSDAAFIRPTPVSGWLAHGRKEPFDAFPVIDRFNVDTLQPLESVQRHRSSNPEVLALKVLIANLQVVAQYGVHPLMKLKEALNDCLYQSLDYFFEKEIASGAFKYITPRDKNRHGATICFSLGGVDAKRIETALCTDKYDLGYKFEIDLRPASSDSPDDTDTFRVTAHYCHMSFSDTCNLAFALHHVYTRMIEDNSK